jgi:hypothetical protein
MIVKVGRIWKEAAMAKFKILSQHLPGGSAENIQTPYFEQSAPVRF